MPLGSTELVAALNGYSLTSPVLQLPVLDGTLMLKDVSAAFLQSQWHWHLSASLTPVSMADFSHAVGWPVMQGKMAASIPLVTYSNGQVVADGAMGFDVFDGSVLVRNLALQNPLGAAPRLQADVQMRNLDLELLTRTYSFGAMTGRLDGDVKNMELSRWQPVKFDADFHSSPGSYPRKISQRAVENISALGGAGAAVAIQRSFLRFFKEFNYAKIGLSCTLRNGVCTMDGAEKTSSGYVIVKGSGIPAITVLGYNRSVSWGELLERIRRITAGTACLRHHQYLFPRGGGREGGRQDHRRSVAVEEGRRACCASGQGVQIMKKLLLTLLMLPLLAFAAADLELNTPAISALKSSMQARHGQLAGHYASGAVGLTRDGLVAIKDANAVPLKDRQAVNALVSAENNDRNALYREIASANGHPEWEAEVRNTFAQRWVQKAQGGWWYQDGNGWAKK